MADLNQCIFIGRLGKDPEVKMGQSGKKRATFSIAVSEKYNGNEKTEWVNAVAFEKTADIVEKYTRKGSRVCVVGKMQSRSWDDQSGNKRYITEILVRELQLLDSKQDSGNYQAGQNAGMAAAQNANNGNSLPSGNGCADDDLPF